MEASFSGLEGGRRSRLRRILKRNLPVPVSIFIILYVIAALMSGTAAAQTFVNPHGAFSSSTALCEICHMQHEAAGSKLVRGTPESALCFTCHNGTGSNYDTATQMNVNPLTNALHPIAVNLPNNNGQYNYTPNTTAGIAPPGPFDCSKCHNPHGDNGNGRLLRNPYATSEFVPFSTTPDPYQACWTCHSSSTLENDTTYFNRHKSHIQNDQGSCSACHFSPHGVPYGRMVRFNPGYVTKSVAANTGPFYQSNGNHTGSCTLSCHGVDHNNFPY